MNLAARIPVLMYHRVGDAHNDWEHRYCVTPQRFAEQMATLQAAGWKAITLAQFGDWLGKRTELPEKSFLLTFDDGFLGVHEHAAPVLSAIRWPAAVFLVSSLIGTRDIWCEKDNPSGTTYPLMDATQIRELQDQGFSFGSHTRSHAELPALDDAALFQELSGSRSDLENLLGKRVEYLAYPFGRHDDRVMNAAMSAGYTCAFSTRSGFNRQNAPRFRLNRIDVFGTDTPRALLRKITLGTNDGSVANAARYYVKRALRFA